MKARTKTGAKNNVKKYTIMVQIKIKCKKVEKKLEEVREIEGIKCNTKLIAWLLQKYDDDIRKEQIETKKPRQN